MIASKQTKDNNFLRKIINSFILYVFSIHNPKPEILGCNNDYMNRSS